jgi:hypothetical protein
MKKPDVEQLIQHLREIAGDAEAAHGLEDGIRDNVLTTIASGELTAGEAAELARLALTTADVKFDRWFA